MTLTSDSKGQTEWEALVQGSPTPDQARALIRHYEDSEWRSNRLKVLKQLVHYEDSRSFQFLIEVIQKNEDLAEQQLAILSLSQRKSNLAARFLRNFYPIAPDTLKAPLAYALGQVSDDASSERLLADFSIAYAQLDFFWLRNIILSLGELKSFKALPALRSLLTDKTGATVLREPSLLAATLFALGRLERDSTFLLSHESLFYEDSLHHQIFQSVLSQIQIRSQFKLEDYLSKILTQADPHPVLPLELRAFDETEVEMGLTLFDLPSQWKRMLLVLRGLPPDRRLAHYSQILAFLRAQAGGTGMEDGSVENEIYFWTQLRRESAHGPILTWGLAQEPKRDAVRFSWLEFCADRIDWNAELMRITQNTPPAESDAVRIRWINLWSDWALTHPQIQQKEATLKQIESWFGLPLSSAVYSRLVRACAELGLVTRALCKRWQNDLKNLESRPSLLVALERFSQELDAPLFYKTIREWAPEDLDQHAVRVLGVLEVLAQRGDHGGGQNAKWFERIRQQGSMDAKLGLLKYLRFNPLPEFEPWVLECLNSGANALVLHAVITLKSYPQSIVASETLAEQLKSPSAVIRGRALDSLCAHAPLVAKKAVLNYLGENLNDEFVVDKIYRSFDPQRKGGVDFAKQIETLLQANPDHPQWEKLVQLRDRLRAPQASGEDSTDREGAPLEPVTADSASALREVDLKLMEVIPQFLKLDPVAQSALRAAEEPFRSSLEMQKLPIDKAPTVLEYCKALDLVLEKKLGQKFLFPKLDTALHEFQTVWQRVGFMDDYPSHERVMTALGLNGKIHPDLFPLHKAKLMAQTFFNGKILQDRFKVFDGLRAWAVIFLIFARKLPAPGAGSPSGAAQSKTIGPLLKLPQASDEECVSVAKRLMVLQDLRNPAAHRQTYTDLDAVMTFRKEAIQLLNTVLKFYE